MHCSEPRSGARSERAWVCWSSCAAAPCGPPVRPRRPGDFIRLRDRGVTKSLKKLYNEAHVPRSLRDTVPVAADEAGVLAVWSLGADERGAPEPGDPVWIIEFEGEINA